MDSWARLQEDHPQGLCVSPRRGLGAPSPRRGPSSALVRLPETDRANPDVGAPRASERRREVARVPGEAPGRAPAPGEGDGAIEEEVRLRAGERCADLRLPRHDEPASAKPIGARDRPTGQPEIGPRWAWVTGLPVNSATSRTRVMPEREARTRSRRTRRCGIANTSCYKRWTPRGTATGGAAPAVYTITAPLLAAL